MTPFLLLLFLSLITCCPNDCTGHGTCGSNGLCTCFPGFKAGDCSLRICPYDDTFAQIGEETEIYKECSGQGHCNRQNGICECFDGFEGTACQREQCPNQCSNHGVCTSVQFVDVVHADKFYLNYYNEEKPEGDYSFVCVCDSGYFGADCGQRKCAMGYYPTSDCEFDPQGPQVVTIEKTDGISGTQGYVSFRDLFGKEWFTHQFNVLDPEAWNTEIHKLPSNVINIDTNRLEIKCFKDNDGKEAVACLKTDAKDTVADNVKKATITIYFGIGISGRQHPIQVINNAIMDTIPDYRNAEFPSGYHGMTTISKDLNIDGTITTELSYIRPPTTCSSNGICDSINGLCQCFKGYYGSACEKASTIR